MSRPSGTLMEVFLDIEVERERQRWVHGHDDDHDLAHTPQEWAWLILTRVTGLSMPWPEAHHDVRRELVEIAAIAVAAIQAHDRLVASTADATMSVPSEPQET